MDDDGLDRILTAPNVITMVRLLCIPVFLWLLFVAHRQTAAAVLLAVLGATDWVDGYVARRYGQVSTFGKVLDPTADRLLVGTAVISIMVYGAVPLWFGIATIAREVLVSAMVRAAGRDGRGAHRRVVGGQGGHVRLDVRLSGLSPGRRDGFLAGAHSSHRVGDGPGRPRARLVGGGELRRTGAASPARGPGRPQERRMKAVIMAGGEGTRLRPQTSNLPKPMLPLVGRPMMEHIVSLLRRHGITDIVVTVAFLPNAIRSYFGDGSELGVRMVLRDRGVASRHGRIRAQRARTADRALPRHLGRRAHRHRPDVGDLVPREERGPGHDCAVRGGEPARVRHRDHA